ncbi:MAG: hypothetical protein HYX52_06800 [Chloroflexi bacterium]|nr:hypothetical protein [Chloroflexota bacterium]
MVDESRNGGMYGAKPWEDRGGMAVGTILATALAAGVIAFLIRRSREEEEVPASRVAKMARTWADSDGMEASREFFMDKILPELKPALMAVLDEIEEAVDKGFRRAEKMVKQL